MTDATNSDLLKTVLTAISIDFEKGGNSLLRKSGITREEYQKLHDVNVSDATDSEVVKEIQNLHGSLVKKVGHEKAGRILESVYGSTIYNHAQFDSLIGKVGANTQLWENAKGIGGLLADTAADVTDPNFYKEHPVAAVGIGLATAGLAGSVMGMLNSKSGIWDKIKSIAFGAACAWGITQMLGISRSEDKGHTHSSHGTRDIEDGSVVQAPQVRREVGPQLAPAPAIGR